MGKNVEKSLAPIPAKPSESESAAIKVAKKLLKKNDDSHMKIKTLAQIVCQQVPDVTSDQVKAWIQKSSKFQIDKKKVSLKKQKRSKQEDSSSEENKEVTLKRKRNNKEDSSSDGNREKKSNKRSTESTPSSEPPAAADNVDQWREQRKIVLARETSAETNKARQDAAFFPFSTFDRCRGPIAPALVQQCTVGNGFQTPSPIQAQAWPILTQGHDVVGIAETGSGKTLAFALPALTRLSAAKKSKKSQRQQSSSSSSSPRMLVLAPTRELAMQSDKVLQEFGAVANLQSLVVYGGVPKYQQTSVLKRGGVDCLVATPGRLKDILQEGSCVLDQVEFLVLDEADRMLDMGFLEEVRHIIGQCPTQNQGRQTAMFSATWPAAIQKIATDFMAKDPIRVYVGFEKIRDDSGEGDDSGDNAGAVDDSLSANKRVKQNVEVVDDLKRGPRLRQLLNQIHKKQKDRVLLFCLYKKEAERMEYTLKREGWNCCSIHGNKHQQARTTALQEFKDGTCPLLIATDVAARGLDIPNVQFVINYTFPLTIEDYVHRIGRTGRAGQTGVSYTFFQPTADKSHSGALQHVLRQADQDIPEDLKKFGSTIKKKEHKLYGNFGPKDGPMKQATKITFESSDEEEE